MQLVLSHQLLSFIHGLYICNDELEPDGRWLKEIELVPEMVIGEECPQIVGECLGDGDDLSKL